MTGHKVIRLRVTAEFFLKFLAAGDHIIPPYRVVKDAVPEDAKVINVFWAWPDCVELLLMSDRFAEVNGGELIPVLSPEIEAMK